MERGHEVHVLTNADEVELSGRQLLLPEDEAWLAALAVSTTGGRVIVHHTSPLPADLSVPIPWAQPYASKLFGRGIDLVSSLAFDLIVGWYLEPYGLVAAQLAQASGARLMLLHAGSDIGRLAKHRDLGAAYGWALRRADYVFTGQRTRRVLMDLGADGRRMIMRSVSQIPDYFSRPHSPLVLEEFRASAVERFREMQLSDRVLDMLSHNLETPPPVGPVIGVLGKVAARKEPTT